MRLCPSIAGATYTHTIDGHSLIPYFQATPGTHRPQEFIQHFPHGHNHDHFALMRRGDWKIIHEYGSGKTQLYHLTADLGEQTDLSKQQPERTASMIQHLSKRLKELDAQYSERIQDNSPVKPTAPCR